MTKEQIYYMVSRFLSWKLPKHFNPDGGITYSKLSHYDYDAGPGRWPIGTNLFSSQETHMMVEHMLDGLPAEVDAGHTTKITDLTGTERHQALEAIAKQFVAECNLAGYHGVTVIEMIKLALDEVAFDKAMAEPEPDGKGPVFLTREAALAYSAAKGKQG